MYDELVKNLRKMQSHEYCVLVSIDGFPAMQIVKQAADAIEKLQGELQALKDDTDMAIVEDGKTTRLCFVKKWIPVAERLPEEDESVLVVRKFLGLKGQVPPSTYVEIAYRIGDGWVADSDEYKISRNRHTDPLYWMPLPQPPESEDE